MEVPTSEGDGKHVHHGPPHPRTTYERVLLPAPFDPPAALDATPGMSSGGRRPSVPPIQEHRGR
eukprot:11297910-Alexandrium_andersonii.AAC.1